MKQAKIYMYNTFAGVLTEDENGYICKRETILK